MKRLILITGFTVMAVASAAIACVDPCTGRYCEHYEFAGASAEAARFPIGDDGVAQVPFYVNPNGNPKVKAADLIGAAKAAARTWERATTGLDIIYKGTTEMVASHFSPDEAFVIGWTASHGSSSTHKPGNGVPDIALNALTNYAWYPCGTAATGACDPTPVYEYVQRPAGQRVYVNELTRDLQDDLTHLFGHALGLHPLHKQGWYQGLTMNDRVNDNPCGPGMVCRSRSTLGRGDILGIRALYPSRCDAPAPRTRSARLRSVCGVQVAAD